jgi:predicted nucleic acid-binding protein
VGARLSGWLASGGRLHAPALTPFEVASGLTRLAAAGAMPDDRVEPAWQAVSGLPVTYHPLQDGPSVVSLARRLERQSAYDAAYLVLARELGGACWTLDGRLVRNATRLGLPVRLAAGTGSNGP